MKASQNEIKIWKKQLIRIVDNYLKMKTYSDKITNYGITVEDYLSYIKKLIEKYSNISDTSTTPTYRTLKSVVYDFVDCIPYKMTRFSLLQRFMVEASQRESFQMYDHKYDRGKYVSYFTSEPVFYLSCTERNTPIFMKKSIYDKRFFNKVKIDNHHYYKLIK